jgi:lipoic acid synthetase
VSGGEIRERIPGWLKTDLPDAHAVHGILRRVSALGLNTVCVEARCPNKGYCFSRGSVTFLILGKNCTRACPFCNVASGSPERVDEEEPEKIGQACRELGLDYVVITSVTRDDLPDAGAGHFKRCVEALKRYGPVPLVEVLTPDFRGDLAAVDLVLTGGPDVFAHNLETVERLYPRVRDGADYHVSLDILKRVRETSTRAVVKSGLILGLGETEDDVRTALSDLHGAGCDIVTLGQYMQPSESHLPVHEYVRPEVFRRLGWFARSLGLVAVCGPLVRSSYSAKPAYQEAFVRRHRCA